jgi:redox-sensitive bicupin YhaK (pirin superfamily)
MLLGGAAVGKRYIWWNFVSSSEERIERAKREWREREESVFPKVPGDDVEFIPLPE